MNSIALRLNRTRWWTQKRRLFVEGPSRWVEVSDHQGVCLTRLKQQVSEKPETLFAGIQLLYGLKIRRQRWLFDMDFLARHMTEENVVLTLQQGDELINSMKWIGEIDPDAHFATGFRRFDHHYGTPLVLLKRLLHRRRYVGPGAGLDSCRFVEFMLADQAYHKKDLARLAAILYREIDAKNSDGRVAFDADTIDARTALFAALDPALLAWIEFSFVSTKLLLQRMFPLVFPEGSSKKNSKPQWLEVAINMAKMDATKVAQVEQLNLYLALKVLNEQIRQASELEEKYQQMKKSK